MNLINTLTYYINMIGIVVIITLGVVGGILYYLVKVRKVAASVEKLDTSTFRREDSIHYVPFDDVVTKDGTLKTDGMIVFDDTYFVGGISVRGFDYPAASVDERIDAQVYSVQFFNVVEKPTSFRQSVKKIDLSENIEYHKELEKKLAKEHMWYEAERKDTVNAADDYIDQPDVYASYEKKLKELQRIVLAKKHQLLEIQALIGYMEAMSGDVSATDGALGQKTSQILFSYSYNPSEHSRELTKEEIYAEAMRKLSATASSYGEALAAAHFRTKRLTGGELISLMRKHTSPITGESFTMNELMDSSYTHLFISCDSLVEECKKKIGEDLFNQEMAEYEVQMAEMLRLQAVERQRDANILKEMSMNIARQQLGMGVGK